MEDIKFKIMKKINTSTGYLIVAAFFLTICLLTSTRTQAQNNLCDSLTYTVVEGLPLTVYGNTNGIINMIDSIEWIFTACNTTTCYSSVGNPPSFPLINMTDTVKFCYDAFIYTPNQSIICTHCDSLVFNYADSTYILLSMGNPTFVIWEDGVRWYSDVDQVYDLLGKKLNYIPVGKMYIKHGKLYINQNINQFKLK